MATTDISFRVFVNKIKLIVESAGLRLCPSIFTIQAVPKTLIDLSFCVDIQSQDTNKYRVGSDELVRISHAVTVRFAKKLKPLDQFESQLDSMDNEETIISKLIDRTNLPDFRVNWKSTRRTITNSREYLLVEILFDVEHDWSFHTL